MKKIWTSLFLTTLLILCLVAGASCTSDGTPSDTQMVLGTSQATLADTLAETERITDAGVEDTHADTATADTQAVTDTDTEGETQAVADTDAESETQDPGESESATEVETIPEDDVVTEAATEADTTEERVAAIIDGMTIEQKVGQLFVVRRPQDEAAAQQAITNYHIGGFTFYAPEFENSTPAGVKSLIQQYQGLSDVPLFIAVDEEGGRVVRASKYAAFRDTPFPSPRELIAAGGMAAVDADAREKSAFLKHLGINLNYAPVCDMSGDPESFIYDRTASNDPYETAEYVRTVVTAMNESGMIGCLKHFPGYGDNVDTHTSIAVDPRPISQFMEKDLMPFLAGMEAGAPIVMIAHNIVNCMDPNTPASLSPSVYRFLRGRLQYNGVVMTDALDMAAITQYTNDRESAVAALIAGSDLLCCTNYETQIPAVLSAVEEGLITEERIEESLIRILTLKIKMGIIA